MPNTNTNIDDFMMYELLEKQAHLQALYDMGAITKHEKEVLSKEMHDEHEHKHENDEHNDLVPCACCGEAHDPDDLVTVHTIHGDELWCPKCVDRFARTCEHCGEIVPVDDTREVCTHDSYWYSNRCYEYWCDDCVDSDTFVCEDCGEYFEMTEIEERYVRDRGYTFLCEGCLDDYRQCSECGDWVHEGNGCYDEHEDCWYCEECWSRTHTGAIHEYGHTEAECFWHNPNEYVNPWRMGIHANELYMGVELETDKYDDVVGCANEIVDNYDECYIELKRDGSLSNHGRNGFEIVSQPMTINTHLDMGMWEWITERVRYYGGLSNDAGTCGFHIHVSRDGLVNHDVVYRLDRIFHRFPDQMARFARRTKAQMDEWCRIDDDDLAEIEDVEERKRLWCEKKTAERWSWRGRYVAINDKNEHTVEVRLWRGTLNMETIRATLEFTWALFDICNKMSDEFADQLTWSMVKVLCRFALEEAGLPHDDFDRYIKRRGL